MLHPSEFARILVWSPFCHASGRGSNVLIQGEVVQDMRKVVRTAVGLLSVAAIMAITATTAFAGGDYNTPGGSVAGEQTGGGTGGGTLPFTGSELLLYVIVGAAIVASGFGLRALSARRTS